MTVIDAECHLCERRTFRGETVETRRRRETEMWFYVVEEVFNSGWGWVRMGEAVQGYLCGTLHQENKCPFVLSRVCLLRFIFPVSCNCRQRLELREQFFDIFKFVCVATELRRRSVHDNKTQTTENNRKVTINKRKKKQQLWAAL